ncbi:hypothetical protein ACWGB8_12060 [Kitasatospora sp. NPDC054939]
MTEHRARPEPPSGELPLSGRELAAIPEVAEAAQGVRALYGIDLLDDATARDVVRRHERLRGAGGWHDEAGGILVLGGAVVAGVLGAGLGPAPSAGQLAGLVAACLAVPVGVLVWVAGYRQGRGRREAFAHFVAYTGLLELARERTAPVRVPPEWSAERARALGGPEDPDGDGPRPFVPVAAVAGHPVLREYATGLGARHGIDYLDEPAVRALLAEQRRAWRRVTFHIAVLIAALLAAGGALFVAATLRPDAAVAGAAAGGGGGARAALVAAGLFGAVALGSAVRLTATLVARARSGLRARAVGYVALLEHAHRCGLAVPRLPSWLDTTERSKRWT